MLIIGLALAAAVAPAVLSGPAWAQAETEAEDKAENRDVAPSGRVAIQIVIDGAIGPATSAYVADGLKAARERGAELVLLKIDTPGGLAKAMRDIVQAILASPVPVVGYVAPSGARAASAGTYILYATHLAAMAPATNLGAATPVSIGGGAPSPPADEPVEAKPDSQAVADSATAKRRKVVNDAVAYIRALANRRGRNADWAEAAVREGTSLSAEAALERNVIDLIAADTGDLLAAIDGRGIEMAGGTQVLATQGLVLETVEPGWRIALLSVLTNPAVAYILLMIGVWGLILEGYSPGAILPGVVGAICLLLALFAFQILPVSFAGLALLLLGVALMIGEAFAPSFGVLGLGGVVAFVFGSIMLMDTGVPGYGVPMALVAAVATASALFMFLIVALFTRSRRRKVVTGREGLVGTAGVALADFDHKGRVRVHGEIWNARTGVPMRAGQPVRVVAVEGLTVTVEPADDAAVGTADNQWRST